MLYLFLRIKLLAWACSCVSMSGKVSGPLQNEKTQYKEMLTRMCPFTSFTTAELFCRTHTVNYMWIILRWNIVYICFFEAMVIFMAHPFSSILSADCFISSILHSRGLLTLPTDCKFCIILKYLSVLFSRTAIK